MTISDNPAKKTGANNTPAVGLTGGIGSGKSTVGNLFSALGVPVIDTDAIARELVKPGQPGLKRIVACFGKQVLHANGSLDRTRLRKIVFENPNDRSNLEQILHPLIRDELRRQRRYIEAPYCILEIPLLLECDWRDEVNRILVVDLPESLQIERTLARGGIDRRRVEQIVATQVERSERLAAADDVVTNEGDRALLEKKVEQLHRMYLKAYQKPG